MVKYINKKEDLGMIITIGREFGSGGRELGRRLSENLGFAYYDKEIITGIAERTNLSEEYVHQIVEHKPLISYPIHIGRSFYPVQDPIMKQNQEIYSEQHKIIKEMAEKSDCIIVGRCADYILKDMNPFKIFVYADMPSKIERCRKKAPENEKLSDKEMAQEIKKIDKHRAKYYSFYTDLEWGARINYDLMINTSGKDIRKIASFLTSIIKEKI